VIKSGLLDEAELLDVATVVTLAPVPVWVLVVVARPTVRPLFGFGGMFY